MEELQFENFLEEITFIAKKLNKQYNYKFECWELINESWLSVYDKKFYDKYIFLNRIKLDMLHYIRTKLGLRNKYSIKEIKNIYNNEEKEPVNNIAEDDQNFNLIENRDLINFLLGKLDERSKKILKKYYLEGKSLIEIGKEMNNIKDVTVSLGKTKAIEKLKKELELLEI